MKYYYLYPSTTLSEVGTCPQSDKTLKMGNVSDYGHQGRIGSEMNLPVTKLDKRAILTDYLHIVRVPFDRFLVISTRFKSAIESLKVSEFQNWKIDIYHNSNLLKYNLLYSCLPQESKFVNYEASKFEVGKRGDWRDPTIRKPVQIDNFNAYRNVLKILREQEDNSILHCSELIVDLSDANEDLFRLSNLPGIGNGYYVSDRFKSAMEEKKITGMQFKEIDQHYKKIKVMYSKERHAN